MRDALGTHFTFIDDLLRDVGTAKWRAQRAEHQAIRWENVLRADPCAYCGEPGETIDHIEPLSRDGRFGYTLNGTSCCSRCNNRKADLSLLHFLNRTVWTQIVERPKLPEAPRKSIFSDDQIQFLREYMDVRADNA
jgi:5-methylcytosine-specific restriction endonuclease McrA